MTQEFFQDKVKKYLKQNKMTQKELAEELNITQPMLSLWLKDKGSLRNKVILQIKEIIGNI